MGYFNITNVQFASSSQKINDNFLLKIQFECLREIKQEIEWKVVYVADSDNKSFDQELDSIYMDSLNYGSSEFDWNVSKPDYSKIPNAMEIFDSTLLMLIVSINKYVVFIFGNWINDVLIYHLFNPCMIISTHS